MSSPVFSTCSVHRGAFSFTPTKVTCMHKRRRSQDHFPFPSKLSSGRYNTNLVYRQRDRFVPLEGFYGRKTTTHLIKAATNPNGANKSDSPFTKVLQFPSILLRFMKPLILIGTVVVFIGMMTRTLMENIHLVKLSKWIILLRATGALFAILCTDGFINGINQIYDIKIDKANKRYHYPLVTEELSLRSAWFLVTIFSAIGITIPILLKSGPLFAYIIPMLVLGAAYSVPPFSLKRSTVGAVLTIGAKGLAYTLSLSATARDIMGLPFQLSAPVIFITIFTTTFMLVIGAMKDIEDLEGDKKYNVPTLASIYGPRKVALFGFGSLLLNYVGAIVTAILKPQVFNQNIMITSHVILGSYLMFQAWKLEQANYNKEASQSVYQSIQKIGIAEIIIFPFI